MEKKLDRLEKSKALFVLVNGVCGIYFFLLNYFTPLAGDDFQYQNIFGSQERIGSLADIVQSQWKHYFTWGGRSVVHTIDQFFLMYDKMAFNIANTIVFLLFVLLIYKCVYPNGISNSFLALEYIALWFCIPGVGTSIVWQTMSCNYLWGSTMVLALFLPYRFLLNSDSRAGQASQPLWKNILLAVLMLPAGLLAGWSIEAGGAMLLAGIVLILFWQKRGSRRIAAWEITGLLGALAGYALLILAPGNYARAEYVNANFGHGNIVVELAYRIARESYYMIIHMGVLLFAAVLLCVLLRKGKTVKEFAAQHGTALFLLGISLLGVYAMTAAAGYAERVLVTPIAFALMACGCLYRVWAEKADRAAVACLICFGCLMMAVQGAAGLYKMRGGDKIMNIRTEYVSSSDEQL